ncbi:hypothetical protein Dimus_003129 [Dionaea muscipula]
MDVVASELQSNYFLQAGQYLVSMYPTDICGRLYPVEIGSVVVEAGQYPLHKLHMPIKITIVICSWVLGVKLIRNLNALLFRPFKLANLVNLNFFFLDDMPRHKLHLMCFMIFRKLLSHALPFFRF